MLCYALCFTKWLSSWGAVMRYANLRSFYSISVFWVRAEISAFIVVQRSNFEQHRISRYSAEAPKSLDQTSAQLRTFQMLMLQSCIAQWETHRLPVPDPCHDAMISDVSLNRLPSTVSRFADTAGA